MRPATTKMQQLCEAKLELRGISGSAPLVATMGLWSARSDIAKRTSHWERGCSACSHGDRRAYVSSALLSIDFGCSQSFPAQSSPATPHGAMKHPWRTPEPQHIEQLLEHIDELAKQSEVPPTETCWQVSKGPFTVMHLASISAKHGTLDATRPVQQYDSATLSSLDGNDTYLDWQSCVSESSILANSVEQPLEMLSTDAVYPNLFTGTYIRED
jgi:hypothetical protein